MKSHNQHRKFSRGMSALFVVIFASILMSLIAVSFASLMIQEQARSTDDEQSQGAYDAAIAGTEDAKRALIECKSGTGSSKAAACAAINAEQCNTVVAAGVAGSIGDDEVLIASNSSGDGQELNLAYSCVIIDRSTDDYLGILSQHDDSTIVPLRVDAADSFDRVRISWFTPDDSATTAPVGGGVPGSPLYPLASWPAQRPPVLRAQVMQYPTGNLSAAGLFNDSPYAHTLYLYPKTAGTSAADFTLDGRRTSATPVQLVNCSATFNPVTGYSCQTTLRLPSAPGLNSANREGYLRLTSIYNGAHFRLEILDSSNNVVPFDDVQPLIDATGRANDIFRRVESRVEYVSDFPYPRATVDITNNFCKTLFVAALGTDYSDGGCLPTAP